MGGNFHNILLIASLSLSLLAITLIVWYMVTISANPKAQYTVKPVLRGHLWSKEKVTSEDRWPLKRDSIYMKFSDRTRKRWPFNTGDCLLEVTALAGLTVSTFTN